MVRCDFVSDGYSLSHTGEFRHNECWIHLGWPSSGALSRSRRPREVRPRGRTRSLEPAADIDLRMAFPAEVPGSLCIGSRSVPLKNRELSIPALNHEPMYGIIGYSAADLTSKFL